METLGTTQGRSPDLSLLVERLLTAGFRVDTRQYQTAYELLLGSLARGKRLVDDPVALGLHLGPIFCTSADEQERFTEVFRSWWDGGPFVPAPPTNEPWRLPPPPQPRRTPRNWQRRSVLFLGFLLAALLSWRLGSSSLFGQGGVPIDGVAPNPISRAQLALLLLITGGLTVLFWSLTERVRRLLVLSRLSSREPLDFATLPSGGPPVWGFAEGTIDRLASFLRRPRSRWGDEVDVTASIEATARGGGLPSPVYTARRAIPECLALVERVSLDDHQSALFEGLLGRLREHGVQVERYFFQGDPRTCFEEGVKARAYSLGELLSRHDQGTLLLFMEAQRCMDLLSGYPHPWVEQLKALPRRALFTPEPPFRWSSAETALAEQGFLVLPANDVGLTVYTKIEAEAEWRIESLFPAEYARPFPRLIATEPWRWLDRVAPPPHEVEQLLAQLRDHLGPEGFSLLAACAVYPELNWPLTFHLSQTLREASPEGAADAALAACLPSLARLPWFRHGFMPEWLRRELIRQLSREHEVLVRHHLKERLKVLAQEALARPDRKGAPGGLRIAEWVEPRDAIQAAPPGSPLRDAVFLGFMDAGQPDASAVEAPSLLRRLFSRVARLPAPDVPTHPAQPRGRKTWSALSGWRDALRALLPGRRTAGMSVSSPARAFQSSTRNPPGLYLLCFVETWERMSYYGMRGLLVLFLTSKVNGGYGWSAGDALSLYGTYTGLVYLTPILGGYIADKFIGQRKAVVFGGTVMMIGHLLLALPSVAMFYAGLGCLIIGSGFFKPNISTMVGGLYAPGDGRRDGAFTIFYMGINLGAVLGNFICGTLGERVGWHYGFGAAGVGMFLGLVAFLAMQRKLLGQVGLTPVKATASTSASAVTGGKQRFTRQEIDRVVVIFIIALFVVAFWTSFEQAGGLMNLYTDQKVDRGMFGWEVPTSWFQNFNSAFIIMLAPVVASVWTWLAARGRDPSPMMKMGVGLLFLSLGFVFMLGASTESAAMGKAAAWWVIMAYLFHTMGELCLAPVGLSMVTKVAPARIVSTMMGVWFLANAAANKLSGVIDGYSVQLDEFSVFLYITIGAGLAGGVLLAITPSLEKRIHSGINQGGPRL